MNKIELRVVILSNDDRAGADDRIADEVRRQLGHPFGSERVYVEPFAFAVEVVK